MNPTAYYDHHRVVRMDDALRGRKWVKCAWNGVFPLKPFAAIPPAIMSVISSILHENS